MSMIHEMIKQNVMDWLDALVIGAKAVTQSVLCEAVDDEENAWRSTAYCFESSSFTEDDGSPYVMIHNVKSVAQAVEFDLYHRVFTPADSHYPYFKEERFFVYDGVKFGDVYGVFSEKEQEKRRNERAEYQRKQSSDSEIYENESVDNES